MEVNIILIPKFIAIYTVLLCGILYMKDMYRNQTADKNAQKTNQWQKSGRSQLRYV